MWNWFSRDEENQIGKCEVKGCESSLFLNSATSYLARDHLITKYTPVTQEIKAGQITEKIEETTTESLSKNKQE